MTRPIRARFRRRRGGTLVEFAFVAVQLFLVLFAALEFGRMVLVYTNVANAARVGARYAIVHGSTRTGSGVNGPSGPGQTVYIVNAVKDFARPGLLDTSRLAITVTYPDGNSNAPGSRVTVRVVYSYDPFTILPLRVPLGSTTEGIITF